MKRLCLLFLTGISIMIIVASCHVAKDDNQQQGSPMAVTPVLSADESLKAMEVEKGFAVKLVASEPLISTPVAMSFDDSLRLWVVEMTDYQPIKENGSEGFPLGRIVILKDTDGDGRMDESKVFMDSLVMPRAICLVGTGVLVATPPKLWYIEINQDRPGKKIIVDSNYTVSGNPEGQTNGLLRSLDNWIYSAGFGSGKRYRLTDGRWQTKQTYLRGQWGISQDNYGRLFYNNNSQNLLGDYFMPGVSAGNKFQKKMAGYNERIVPDNRVYPARPTPGVNRGYKKGILDDSLRLVDFTAACGPVIYRGNLFGRMYNYNAFVCEPAANLIKRDILEENGYKISGRQAYQGKEFLSSTDERFRPVSLYNGPDGALYVVDMYRGIIQDNLSLTDYLKKYVLDHALNKPFNCGRIYKIVPVDNGGEMTSIPDDPDRLVSLLKSENGWVRDHAQQRLVDGGYLQAAPALRKLLQQHGNPLATTHALWTLEGMGELKTADIIPLLKSENEHIRIQALSSMINIIDKTNYKKCISVIEQLIMRKDSVMAPYIAFSLNYLQSYTPVNADHLLDALIERYPGNTYVIDAVISSIQGKEKYFLRQFPDTTTLFYQRLRTLLQNESAGKNTPNIKNPEREFPKGYAIFNTICQTCHGADGNGIEFLAPPLNGSDWVTGDKGKLIPIVLYGLTGPVTVSGKMYKKPEVIGDMPGFGNNNKFSDQAIAELLSFLRASWNNHAGQVVEGDIIKVRKQFKGRENAFTTDELKKLFPKRGK